MSSSLVIDATIGTVARITMNRPERSNPMNAAMLGGLAAARQPSSSISRSLSRVFILARIPDTMQLMDIARKHGLKAAPTRRDARFNKPAP